MSIELPDLRRVGIAALDTEVKDDGLFEKIGSAWPWRGGYICGVSVAWRADGGMRSHYISLAHPDSENVDRDALTRWLRDLFASDARIVTQNGLFDYGWLHAELGIAMPPAERLEEIGALATIVDENRIKYGLDDLCRWRGIPGKDEAALLEGCAALDLMPAKSRKKFNPQTHIWQLPARFVQRYAEQDTISTLLLFESLEPVLDRENTRDAYRLEVDLLPMVHAMRRRGIRIDAARAEQVHNLMLARRNAVLAQLSEKHGADVGMTAIRSDKQLAAICDGYGIKYPLTEKGAASFKAGRMGWMDESDHWLPQLVANARRYDNSAKFVESIVDHARNGRVFGEIHPHRSDVGGTRTLRFSYSHPALQQTPKHNAELAPLIRSVFLPEEGEVWASCDLSQQEFRLIVHYAVRHSRQGAAEMRDQYIRDPRTDIHAATAERSSGALDRQAGKTLNFGKFYGMGLHKFAHAIGKPLNDAQKLYDLYDQIMPFVSQLSHMCKQAVWNTGHLSLLDHARMHFNQWAAGGKWRAGAGPCSRTEAERRVHDPSHPWYGQRLYRADAHKALNTLIQGSAARYTKIWMREVWRAGVVPMLQMHDSLDLSVSSPEQAEMVARLGEEAVKLEVPMVVDVKFGRTWANAEHKWSELGPETSPHVELAVDQREAPKFSNDFHEAPDSAPWEGDENFETPPAHEVDWSGALDQDFPRVGETATAAAAESSPPPPQDDDEFIRTRLAEEGISQSPPPSPPPSSPPSGSSSGDGRGDGFSGHAGETDHDDGDGRWYGRSDTGARDSYPHGERDDFGNVVAEYYYRNLKGALHLKVVKRVSKSGKKSYPQYHLENIQWVKGAPAGPAIPYRLPELLAAPPNATVEICEGEKDADNLAALDLIATTNPMGAGKWTPDLNKWFAGFVRANIYEDNDEAGRKHAAKVARELCGVVPDIRIISFRDLPDHTDVSDWLKSGKTREELLAYIEQAPKFMALESMCAADVEIEDYEWVWPGRFALKKIGLITGLPDEGKGVLISDIIARVTNAGVWPCDEGTALIGNVILFTAEDDSGDTIVPRLMAAGADIKRVHIIKMMHEADKERMFSLVTDLPMLRQKVLAIGDVKMIIIDPIAAYLGIGEVDSFRATDVRAVIGPLKEFAEEFRLFILGIMHFNKKIDVTNLLLRVSDSLAYTAAARHVYGIVNDEDNDRKLFVKGKNNIAPRAQKTLAFSFDDREVGTDRRTGKPIRAPYIVWHSEPVDITATEALQALAGSKSPSARDNAKHFIEALLENGPVGAKDVQEAAKENGISRNTLRRAAEDLKIIIKKDGPKNDKGEATWQWRLPAEKKD